MSPSTSLSLDELIQQCPIRLQAVYAPYLAKVPALSLKSALSDTLQNHGKYLRPLLVYATGAIFAAPLALLDVPAAAVELIHTYSLIHDDLPCMDDAALRRGKPACHITHGEAMAVLAGDALQTLALQILADHPVKISAQQRVALISMLTLASGPFGMVAGQALDLEMMNDRDLPLDLVKHIYALKTGTLLSTSVQLGQIAAGDDDEHNARALQNYGDCIGLAFQIQDDILDFTGTDLTGKPQGQDAKNNKQTYAQKVGIVEAKAKVDELFTEALQSITYFGEQAQLLRALTLKLFDRKS